MSLSKTVILRWFQPVKKQHQPTVLHVLLLRIILQIEKSMKSLLLGSPSTQQRLRISLKANRTSLRKVYSHHKHRVTNFLVSSQITPCKKVHRQFQQTLCQQPLIMAAEHRMIILVIDKHFHLSKFPPLKDQLHSSPAAPLDQACFRDRPQVQCHPIWGTVAPSFSILSHRSTTVDSCKGSQASFVAIVLPLRSRQICILSTQWCLLHQRLLRVLLS